MPAQERVRIVEVGPRDGLQNEPTVIDSAVKLELVRRLVGAGLRQIEVTAFVSPRWVPQMADHQTVMAQVMSAAWPGGFSALTPNLQGYQAARAAGAQEVAVFAAASEDFSRRNINCSIEESLQRFRPVLQAAHEDGVAVRAYVSCVLGCPYAGAVAPAAVADLAERLRDMGCYEISLGDTIGVGTPDKTRRLLEQVLRQLPADCLAGHFHDTYGQALVNVYAALDCGLRTFDAAVAGLGGCPYAAGASGNLATEDLVYMLQGMGLQTGVDLDRLVDAGAYICGQLGRRSPSRVARALGARPAKAEIANQQKQGGTG